MTGAEAAEEKRREKARNLRYKKPILKELNWETITSELYDMQEACSEAAYYIESDDKDMLYSALDGNEDDVEEFKMQFTTLENELEMLMNDLNGGEYYLPLEDDFNDFFAAIGSSSEAGFDVYGYDSFEGDYFGLGTYESEYAVREATERLKRLTKADLIERAQLCFKIAFNYIALRVRYNDLEAALDILRAENHGITATIKEIEKAYERAEADKFYDWDKPTRDFEQLIRQLPDRVWIE